jgi:fructosamine-3-kinase
MLLQTIFDDCGIQVSRFEAISGGDVNRTFCLFTDKNTYFLKVNDAILYPRMFEREADGLNALRENCLLKIPQVIKQGVAGNHQYLLLEWIEKEMPLADTWEHFGIGLAKMHKQPQSFYGWGCDNYIGRLPQCNDKHNSWSEFYTQCRIMPMATHLYNLGAFSNSDIKAAEKFCGRFDELFPKEQPSILHGDLWGGNYLITNNGQAALIDPAVYCGHREMDIGMTKLFGGFDQRFYEAYNEYYPLEKGWQHRLSLTQAYPLLVHAVMFGGHYVRNVKEVLKGL